MKCSLQLVGSLNDILATTLTFCLTIIFVEHISAAVLAFCVPCELETPNVMVFFQYLHLPTSYDNKCGNILEETYKTYHITLQ